MYQLSAEGAQAASQVLTHRSPVTDGDQLGCACTAIDG